MPVRRCTEADIPDVARVCARACAEDPLLGDLMHPHRDQYPEDFVEYFRKRLAEHFYESAHHHLITFETQGAAEVITGYADWLRHDEGDGEDRASTTKTDTLENRAADPEKADVVERAEEFTKHYWTGARAKTWFLDLLVVDPEHQRKGCGRDLDSGFAVEDYSWVLTARLQLLRDEGILAKTKSDRSQNPTFLDKPPAHPSGKAANIGAGSEGCSATGKYHSLSESRSVASLVPLIRLPFRLEDAEPGKGSNDRSSNVLSCLVEFATYKAMVPVTEPNLRSFAPITSYDKAGYVWVASLYGMVLSIMVLAIRIWLKRAAFGKDDGLFVAASVVAMAHSISVFVALKNGLGTSPIDGMQRNDTTNGQGVARNSTIAAYMFLLVALALAKSSTIMFIQRLLSRDMKPLLITCYAAIVVFALWAIGSMIGLATGPGCVVDSFISNTSCTQNDPTWVAIAAFDTATELVLVIMPFIVVWPLQLSFDLKVQVVVAFSFRLGVGALSIAHAIYVRRAHTSDSPGVAFVPALVLAESELCWSLISATIPNLKAFMNIFNTGFGLNDLISSARGTVANSSGSRPGGMSSHSAIQMQPVKARHSMPHKFSLALRPDHGDSAVVVSRGHTPDDSHSIGSDGSQEMIIHKTVDHQVTYEYERKQ
ncbi:hypothetical protein Q7P37_002307 [Cladosporium fusiforme]